jgi:hypothetical protein
MTQRTYMYVVLYHYTCYNLCHSSMIDSSNLLWDFKIMSFNWTIVSSARDVCKQRLLPFTVRLQIYVFWLDYIVVCLWCLSKKIEYEVVAGVKVIPIILCVEIGILGGIKVLFSSRFYLYWYYSKTCLNRTPMGLHNLFSVDRYSVYTGSNYIDIY